MEIQEAVSRAVRIELARSGQNQSDLAREMGMNPASFANRLAGRVTWSTADLAKICQALGLDSTMFLRRVQDEIAA